MSPGISNTALILAIAALLAIAFTALALTSRSGAVDERCRFRLLRLGGAVDAWMEDHGHHDFPSIVNPKPGEPWLPARTGSTGVVLWDYLGGNIPPKQHPDESTERYLERLRGSELSVCPASGLEYWYNDSALGAASPAEIMTRTPPEIWYFHCQHALGKAPHRLHGADGTFSVVGQVGPGDTKTVTRADLDAMRAELAALEAKGDAAGVKDRVERIGQLRSRIDSVATALGSAERVEMKRLSAEVRFMPDP